MKKVMKDLWVVLFATLILGLALSYPNRDWKILLMCFGIILLIISINMVAKKIFGYYLEADVNFSFWSIYWFGFSQKSHFKKPIPMAWLPLVASLASFGNFIWIPIIEFDVLPRPERVSRRHGLYRYTMVTEWHMALIALVGIFASIITGVAGYILGFELFAKWSIFYAAWSILPMGKLDGSKIFFGSRKLWFFSLFILIITLLWGLTVV